MSHACKPRAFINPSAALSISRAQVASPCLSPSVALKRRSPSAHPSPTPHRSAHESHRDRITSRLAPRTSHLAQHVSRPRQRNRRARRAIPRRRPPQLTAPHLAPVAAPLLAHRDRAPGIPAPLSFLRRRACAQTPPHSRSPTRPRLRPTASCAYSRACTASAPVVAPRRRALRRGVAAQLHFVALELAASV